MKTVYRQRLSSGRTTWTHRPVYDHHLEIVDAERSYCHVGEHAPKDKVKHGGRVSKYRGDENPRAAEQFEQIYSTHHRFVRLKVHAVVPRSAVSDMCADIWTRFWVNLKNVPMPDALLIPSLVRQIQWTLNVEIRKWKSKHSFIDATADKVDVELCRDFRPSVEDVPALSDLYESDLQAALKKLNVTDRKTIERYLQNGSPLRSLEHVTARLRAERQLSEILTGLDR